MIQDILKYQYLQYALITSVLVSLVAGLIGVIIVEKKQVMLTGGIAHTSYGGVGLGYLLGFEPLLGAFIFAVTAALGSNLIKNRMTGVSDVIIAIFWSLGMSLGILFIGLIPGYPPDVTSYLFGNILSVTTLNLVLMAIITLIVLIVIVVFFQDWRAHLFDPEFTTIRGKRTKLMENILLFLIAITVVALIRVVGIILVIALLSIPAATASLLTRKLHLRMILAVLFGLMFTIFGLFISAYTMLSSGAVIVIFGFAVYIITYLGTRYLIRVKKVEAV
ncbi:MAG: metal ABC transporter permease [Bacilli bacterium]|nr:metal ABC transporter permease [Bacilli bacterium]MBN2876663.1 metal ABC transporter permease [Bacilli bacterium]